MAPFKKLDKVEICCSKGNVFGTGGTFDASTDDDFDARGDEILAELDDSSIEKVLKISTKKLRLLLERKSFRPIFDAPST